MPFSFPYTKIDSLGIKNRRLTFTISEINGVFEEVTVKILDSCGELITGHNVNVSGILTIYPATIAMDSASCWLEGLEIHHICEVA